MSSGALAFSHLTLSRYELRRSNSTNHRTNNIRCIQSVIKSEAPSCLLRPMASSLWLGVSLCAVHRRPAVWVHVHVSTGWVKSWEPVYEQLAISDKIACLRPFMYHCCYQTSQWCLKPAAMWLKAHLNLISFFFFLSWHWAQCCWQKYTV